MKIPVDITCLVSSITFVMGSLLHAGYTLQLVNHSEHASSYMNFMSLDPFAIQNGWQWLSEHSKLELVAGILTALGWFLLAIPLVQLAHILSMNGSRMMGLHTAVSVLAIGAATTDLCASLMYHGAYLALEYMANNMNLDDFSTEGDEAGWKVLSLLTLFAKGMTHIVTHMELLFLSVIFALLFLSVFAQKEKLFSQRWAFFGVGLSGLCLFSFIVALRNTSGGFSASHVINGITKIALLPIWILWLGKQLPMVRKTTQELAQKQRETEISNTNLNENDFS